MARRRRGRRRDAQHRRLGPPEVQRVRLRRAHGRRRKAARARSGRRDQRRPAQRHEPPEERRGRAAALRRHPDRLPGPPALPPVAPRRGHRDQGVDARVAAAHHRGQRRVRQERREGAGARELPQVDVRGDGPAHDVAVDVRRFDGPRRVGEAVEVREGLARGRRDAYLDGRRRPRRRQRRDVDAVRPRERPVVGLGDCRVAQQRVERHGALAHDAREGRVARVQEGDGRHGQPRRLEARQAHGAGARAPRRGPVALDDADAVLEELVLERRRILGSGAGRGAPLAAVVRRVHAAAEAAAEAGRGERRRDGVDRAAQRRRHGLEVLVVARRLVEAQGLDAHDEALRGPRVLERVLDRGF